jgi:hypothetical protein
MRDLCACVCVLLLFFDWIVVLREGMVKVSSSLTELGNDTLPLYMLYITQCTCFKL